MKVLWTVLAAVTLTAGAALADATMPTTTTQQTVTPSTSTTVTTTTATCPVMPATTMVMPTTPMMMPTTAAMCPMPGGMAMTTNMQVATATCPVGMPMAPAPCSAKTSLSISNHPQVLVLGSEETFALSNLGVRRLNWSDTVINSPSVFAQTNPLTNNMPNASITRHGNPNFPYYAVDRSVRVAGTMEQYTRTMPMGSQDMLSAVKEHYRGLTPQQAMAMGYMPLQACVQNVGFVYINQSIIDNKFDPMMPEAFVFDNDGNLASVQYVLLSDVPFAAFGQPFQASPLVAGALQLPVWLYHENDAGMFTMAMPDFKCATTMTAPATTPMMTAPRQY